MSISRAIAVLLTLMVSLHAGCSRAPRGPDYSDVPPPEWSLEVFLGPDALKKHGAIVAGPIAIDAAGRVIIGTGDNLFDLGSRKLLLKDPHPGLEGVIFTSDGGVITLCHGKLGYLDSGKIVEKTALPASGMRLAPGSNGRLYVYGGHGDAGRNIYMVIRGGKYAKLIETTENVTALVESEGRLFFCAGNVIYLMGREARPLLALPSGSPVTSIAVDREDGTIYVAKGEKLLAVQLTGKADGFDVNEVGQIAGDEIHVHDERVYILSRARGTLLRGDPRGR